MLCDAIHSLARTHAISGAEWSHGRRVELPVGSSGHRESRDRRDAGATVPRLACPAFMVSWSRLGFRERPSTGRLDDDHAGDEAKSDVELGMFEEMTVALVPGTVVEVVSKSSERFGDCRCR